MLIGLRRENVYTMLQGTIQVYEILDVIFQDAPWEVSLKCTHTPSSCHASDES